MWIPLLVSLSHWAKKASIPLSRAEERACVNWLLSSHLTDVTLQTPSAHVSLLSPELRASSEGKAFVLLHLLTSHRHHVGGFKCVRLVLGMKHSGPNICYVYCTFDYGGLIILVHSVKFFWRLLKSMETIKCRWIRCLTNFVYYVCISEQADAICTVNQFLEWTKKRTA